MTPGLTCIVPGPLLDCTYIVQRSAPLCIVPGPLHPTPYPPSIPPTPTNRQACGKLDYRTPPSTVLDTP